MQRRRKLILFTGLGMTAIVILGFWIWPQPTVISQADLEKIHKGMTREEVTVILRVPPGDYIGERPITIDRDRAKIAGWGNFDNQDEAALRGDATDIRVAILRLSTVGDDDPPRVFIWLTESAICAIVFDETGRVGERPFLLPVRPVPESPWQMLCRWFRNWM